MSEDTQRLASQEPLGFDDEAENNATTPRAGGGVRGSLFETVLHGHPASSPAPRKIGFSSAGLARRNPEDARKSATKNPIVQSLLQNKAALRAKIAKEQQRRKIEKSQSLSQENSIGCVSGVANGHAQSATEERDTRSIEEHQQLGVIFTPSPSTQITSDDEDDLEPPQPNAAVIAARGASGFISVASSASSSCDTNDAEDVEEPFHPDHPAQKQPSSLIQETVGSTNNNAEQPFSVSTDTPEDEKPLFKPPHQNLVDTCNNMWAETPMSPPAEDTQDKRNTSYPPTNHNQQHQRDEQQGDVKEHKVDKDDDAVASETQERSPTTISPEGNPNKYFEDFIREFHEPTQEEEEEEVLTLTLRVGECVLGTQVPDLTPRPTQNAAAHLPPPSKSPYDVAINEATSEAVLMVKSHEEPVVDNPSQPLVVSTSEEHQSSMERKTSTVEGVDLALNTTTIGEQDSAYFVAPVISAKPQSSSSLSPAPPPSSTTASSKASPMWYKCKKRYWHRRTYMGGCIIEVRWGGRWHAAVVVSIEADAVYNVRWIKKKYLRQVMELYCSRLQGQEIDLDTLADGSSSGTLEEAQEVKAVLQNDHTSEFDATVVEGDIRVPVGAVPKQVTVDNDLYFDDSSLLVGAVSKNNNKTIDIDGERMTDMDLDDEDSMSIADTVKKHKISSSQAHLLFGTTQSSTSSILASSSPIAEPDMQQPVNTAEPSPVEEEEKDGGVFASPPPAATQHEAAPTSNINTASLSPTQPKNAGGGQVDEDMHSLVTPPQEPSCSSTHHTFCWSTHHATNYNSSGDCGTQVPVGGTQASGRRVLEGVHVLLLGGYGVWTPQAPSQLDISTINPSIVPSPRRIVGNLLRSIYGVSKVHEGVASLLRALPDLIGGGHDPSLAPRDNVLVIGLTNGSSIPSYHIHEAEGAGGDFAAFLEPYSSLRSGDNSSVSPLRGSQQQLHGGGSSIVASPSRDSDSLLHIQMRYNMIGVRALGLEPIEGDVLLSPRVLVSMSLVEEEQHTASPSQHHHHLSTDRVVSCQGEINIGGLDLHGIQDESVATMSPFQQFIRMVSGATSQPPYPTTIPLHDRVLARHVILLPNAEDIVPQLEGLRDSEEAPSTTDPTAIGKKRGRTSDSHSVNPRASNLLRSASELNVVINRLRTLLAVAGATVADSAEEAIVALHRGRSVVQEHGSHLTEGENKSALQDVDTNVELELLLSTVWLISPNDIVSCCSTSLSPLGDGSNIATIKQVEEHANLPGSGTAPWTRVVCHVATARAIVQSIMGCTSLLLEDAKVIRGEEVRTKGPAWLRSNSDNTKKVNDEITPVREELEGVGSSSGGDSVAPSLSEVDQQPPDAVIERALYIDDDYNEEAGSNYMRSGTTTTPNTVHNNNDTVATTANIKTPTVHYVVSEHEYMVPSILVSDSCTVCVGDDYYVTTPSTAQATDSEGDVEEEEESELGRVEQICIRQTLHTLDNGDVECVGEEVLVMVRLYDFSVVSVRRVQRSAAQHTNTISSNTSGVEHGDQTTTASSLGAKRSRGEIGEASSVSAGPRLETRRLRRPRVHLSPFRTKVVLLSNLDLVTPTYVIDESLLDHVYVLAPSSAPQQPPDSPHPTLNTGAASSGRTPLLPPPPLPPPSTPAAPQQHHSNPYITALPASSPPHNRYGFPVRSP